MANNNVVLDLANYVTVTISLQATIFQTPNANTAILFSMESPSWLGSQTYAIYTSAAPVGVDFGTGSKAFALATAFFSQTPNPSNLNGYLVIAPRLTVPSEETLINAITRLMPLVFFFGILTDEDMDAQGATFAAVAAFVQTLDKVFVYASHTIGNLAPSSMFDNVRAALQSHTRCLYFSDGTVLDTAAFAAAYLGRALTVNFSGSDTAMTMHGKPLVGVLPDQTLNQTYVNQAALSGVDLYFATVAGPAVFTSGANQFWDVVYLTEALKFQMQANVYNAIPGAANKVPQTEAGMDVLRSACQAALDQFVTNGTLAPGTWTSSTTFGPGGDLIRNVADKGYYIWSQPVSQQAASARTARQAPPVQIAAKLAGALHSASVTVNITA